MNRVWACLLVVIFMAGCNNNDGNPDAEVELSFTSKFVMKDKFGQEVDSFTVGETVVLELQVTNRSAIDVTYEYTAPGYSFTINANDSAVWRSNHDTVYSQVVTSGVIEAKKTHTYSIEWTGVNFNGDALSPGVYLAVPELGWSVNGSKLASPEARNITLH